uniref:Reverse transcriptase domain-containing protein n=1 Tax=Leptobrachium leishanense TaxID=445787 RepID=A0A8C5PT54_9ANUR
MTKIRFISLNVRGLNLPQKRRKALTDLHRQGGEIVFLQETHFRADVAPSLNSRYYSQNFYSNYGASKARGVAILLARHIPFTVIQQQQDANGRFLFVKGTLGNQKITLANIYLPNRGQCAEFRSILTKLDRFREGLVICGGDFNVSLDSSREGVHPTPSVDDSLRGRFLHLLHKYQLVDGWRALNPTVRDYTFYSTVAHSYSRLDTFLIPHHQLHHLTKVKIAPITWSDHAPVLMWVDIHSIPPPHSTWRLNESLLRDVVIRQNLQDTLTRYFDENSTPDIPSPTLWEAHKCVIRGHLIQIGAQRKREHRKTLDTVLKRIHDLETAHKSVQSLDIFKDLTEQRAHLNSLLSQQAFKSMLLTKQTYYTQGNKCGRLLANALKQRRQATYIPKIKDRDGREHHLTKDISEAFHKYFTSLYQLRDSPPLESDIRSYLKDSLHSVLPPDSASALDAPFTTEEFSMALSTMKAGKSPGPDGFSVAYYKTFGSLLGPRFLAMLNSLDGSTSLEQATLRAHIALIPKPERDHTSVTNYRPISLLNVDVKIMTKMMATRLNPYVPGLVHPDQTGFVPTREARDNTIRAINLIHLAVSSHTPTIFLSIDAEKAFDRVDWAFLLETLSFLGFGSQWLTWIKNLYSTPTASLRVNGTYSPDLDIRNGTRQGCPLSPLLFILTLEPLLQRIRDHPHIHGHSLPLHQYKVAAFADDILLSLTKPLISLEHLMKELNTYGKLSNFKINLSKCEVLGVGVTTRQKRAIEKAYPFKWARGSIRYLGVSLPNNLNQLYAMNYEPLLRTITQDLRGWKLPHVSWLGRINILKMNILPRLLYIFQTVPIGTPPQFFALLRTRFLEFIWHNTRPRVSYADMTRHRNRGGLGLPHIELYHTAALFLNLSDWSMSPPHKLWVPLAQRSLSVPITTLPWQTAPIAKLLISPHPIVTPILRKWRTLRTSLALSTHPSPLTPVTFNPNFPEGMSHHFLPLELDGPYLPLATCLVQTELQQITTMLRPDTITPLTRYRQLTHFIQSLGTPLTLRTDESPFETLCVTDPRLPHMLSTMYGSLLDASTPGLPSYAGRWDRDMGNKISEEEWGLIFQTASHASRSLHIQQTHYKLLMRWYLTPTRLHKIYPSTDQTCWRCQASPGTFVHIWWECPSLRAYWESIFSIVNEITGLDSCPSLEVALFHLVPISTLTYRNSLAIQLFNVAKSLIPRKWRSTTPPTVWEWIQAVEGVREMEEMFLSMDNKYDKYFVTWYWWLDFRATRSQGYTPVAKSIDEKSGGGAG